MLFRTQEQRRLKFHDIMLNEIFRLVDVLGTYFFISLTNSAKNLRIQIEKLLSPMDKQSGKPSKVYILFICLKITLKHLFQNDLEIEITFFKKILKVKMIQIFWDVSKFPRVSKKKRFRHTWKTAKRAFCNTFLF